MLVDLWESYLEPAPWPQPEPKEPHDRDEPAPTTSYPALRARAIESLLIDKGYLTADAVDYVVNAYEHDIGPMRGARLVARAWVDPAFKERLLENASEAARELGVAGFVGEHVMAVENTDEVHNVVGCTLCSCYPWAVLGLPPSWYKSPEYRSRIVREPRACSASSASSRSPAWRSASGTRAPTCATSCCRSARPGPTP